MIRIKRKSVASDFDMVDETLEKRPKVCSNPLFLPGNILKVAFAVRAQAMGKRQAMRPKDHHRPCPAQVLN